MRESSPEGAGGEKACKSWWIDAPYYSDIDSNVFNYFAYDAPDSFDLAPSRFRDQERSIHPTWGATGDYIMTLLTDLREAKDDADEESLLITYCVTNFSTYDFVCAQVILTTRDNRSLRIVLPPTSSHPRLLAPS